ncbi:MAG: hypothetical protein A2563_01245 [Candidatus Magasanikbacteria bacterium RIFOXYD1_FULL_40_23]|uniref:Uncharacterized protein n=1 Tax=Candidatus Magasanikbacteria bacterium RIFOXYD1_FULL_40_23 TaxID=1798705 RepID=A0A1F6PB79_9BACT|nr:MAG: hypothetical protein A2563_01245 [Candidatus Magasanikbacteria bacterium RIFOXYD1_FULL_40_23]
MPGEKPTEQQEFFSRGRAAEILGKVAEYGESGHWPNDISPYDIGRALGRLMPNNGAPNEYNLAELIRGMQGVPSQRLELVDSE